MKYKEPVLEWTTVGAKFVQTDEDKQTILKEMKKLSWLEVARFKSGPFSPVHAIQTFIRELRIPNVDMIAGGGGFGLSVEPSAGYGFYGIQANYKGHKVRIHLLDTGVDLTAIVIEVYGKILSEVEAKEEA